MAMIDKISVSTQDLALTHILETEKISLGNLKFSENCGTAHKNLFLLAVFARRKNNGSVSRFLAFPLNLKGSFRIISGSEIISEFRPPPPPPPFSSNSNLVPLLWKSPSCQIIVMLTFGEIIEIKYCTGCTGWRPRVVKNSTATMTGTRDYWAAG